MQIFIPKETMEHETRIPILPVGVEKLIGLGAVVFVEKDLGKSIYLTDQDYQNAGASISGDRKKSLSTADMVLRLNPSPIDEIKTMKKKAMHISFMDPFDNYERVLAFAKNEISAFSMELIPRTTIAQKMDVLSSQANLAGYAAVITAANHFGKIFPMMMTPSGTLPPTRVFIIGAGVAGLQAIATAKRLGAKVEAFDTRPVVAEQVQSLGAKFVKIDLGETGQTKGGYAKELTKDQLQKQREAMTKACSKADIVISTAKVFGKKAPLIITKDMLQQMKPGSVLVDLAVDQGGNIEGSKINEVVKYNGVSIIGYENLARSIPESASAMYSNNLVNFIEHAFDQEKKEFKIDLKDEIIVSSLVTHEGKIINEIIDSHCRQLSRRK